MKINKQKLKNLQKAKKGIQNTTKRNSKINNSRTIDTDDPLIYDKMLKDNNIRYDVTEKSQPEEFYMARQEAAIKEFSKVPSYHDGRCSYMIVWVIKSLSQALFLILELIIVIPGLH